MHPRVRLLPPRVVRGGALILCAAVPALGQGFQPRMGEPLRGLTPAERARFDAGAAAFERSFLPSEGLGPVFNDQSCAVCHFEPRAGGGSTRTVTRFGRAGAPFDPLVHRGGSLLQTLALDVAVQELLPPEADVVASRATTPLFGLGLVEAIGDDELVALAAAQPPAVAGTPHFVTPLGGGALRVGRFGWKAQIATLLDFSADATLEELGITNRLLPAENAPGGDVRKLVWDTVPDPEDGPDAAGLDFIDRVADFQRMLAPPPQTPRSGMAGEALFEAIGCAACHVPSFTTPPSAPIAALAGVAFRPYSDFLLHDVGALGDAIVQGAASETAMRTAPLWGLAHRTRFLHDGRAGGAAWDDGVRAAIAEHAGDASASRDAFGALAPADEARVLAFLASLGRAELDVDGDHDVDALDWAGVEAFATAPGAGSVAPDDAAALADVDADGDVDLADLALFQRAFTGAAP